ncbi:MAG: patatin-like phospholipase family protein [Parvularculaceae bacterium]|nr:patatin-like phospholipase family protein [Parvularculaceae bacterium]
MNKSLHGSDHVKKFGLVLGSGAARGWAHVGVLKGLEEIGLRPDVIAGCSVGALVGGAYLVGALKEFEAWARELKPLSALQSFAFSVSRGGLVDAAPAFKAFESFDRRIEDLPVRYGAVAADLGTGEEVWLTEGSLIEAARASSAIPVLFHAVRRDARWLVDGAIANPAPVNLARALGADVVVSVDLNAVPRVLDRFNPPPPVVRGAAVSAEKHEGQVAATTATVSASIAKLLEDTRRLVELQIESAKARSRARPHLFETAYAAADIFQMHLARAHAQTHPPDIALAPDMRDALPTAFDRADEFIAEGRRALLERRAEIERLLS